MHVHMRLWCVRYIRLLLVVYTCSLRVCAPGLQLEEMRSKKRAYGLFGAVADSEARKAEEEEVRSEGIRHCG